MKEIREIEYGSEAYKDTLELRNKVMRLPLGSNIYDEDLRHEERSLILGAYQDGNLIGTTVMSFHGSDGKVDTLCIDTKCQHGGTGTMLLQELEKRAKAAGYKRVIMDARVSAEQFYIRYGYTAEGGPYKLPFSPIPHVKMTKKLK